MNLFADPVTVFLVLLSIVICFSLPMYGTYWIMKKTGLWNKMQEEVRAKKLENDIKERVS